MIFSGWYVKYFLGQCGNSITGIISEYVKDIIIECFIPNNVM